MKKIVFSALFLLLAGCATEQNYKNMLNTWLGIDEIDLIRKWGPPANSYEVGSSKFIIYSSTGNMYLPGTSPTYTTNIIGNTAYTTSYGGTPAQNIQLSCETTFELQNGKVVNWSYKGNNCAM